MDSVNLMDLKEAIEKRHAVRAFTEQAVPAEITAKLESCIDECNKEGGLNIQLVLNEEKAFDGWQAHYGKFSGVRNYIALVAKKGMDEKIGYYGEKIVLLAQSLGLSSCWVALTFSKKNARVKIGSGEKFYIAIPFGYGASQGVQHKSKPAETVSNLEKDSPEWFKSGVELALLAPTAMNQQKFYFTLLDDKKSVLAKASLAPCAKIDLGIAKYHFEIGAGKENVKWV